MKLKPQPPMPKTSRPKGRRAKTAAGSRGRGRQARRPAVPLSRRLSGRLPSIRRLLTGVGAIATAAVLVALVNGPWLRVSDVAWAGDRYTDSADLEGILARERGASLLAVDTRWLGERLERIPSVADASVTASLTGRIEARVTEREAAFVWETSSGRFVGAADGTIFVVQPRDSEIDDELAGLPSVLDQRFVARLVTVGDVIPEDLLHAALRVAAIDPAMLGSTASRVGIRLDDEYGIRIVSSAPPWEVALGVYGLDPRETRAEADARLERQVTAVRTLFAREPEAEIGWVDVRNPGKVYFRAKG